MVTCYIGIGSNLGDRQGYIDRAIAELRSKEGIKVKRVSSIYETEPTGGVAQGKFLNGVIEIEVKMRPRELLRELNEIEKALGRNRTVKDGPRTIDLDILYYGEERIGEKGLVIPHPRIGEREFVLRGLRELGRVSK
jgi:2-amino-4-hydroxy-6-hydroxymethyldihydropteridine diphosphokinase